MRLLVLTTWVCGLASVVHYCVLGRVDLSSFLFGIAAMAMVGVIAWDGRVEEYEE